MLFLKGSRALEAVPHINILKLGVFLLGTVAPMYRVDLAVQLSTCQEMKELLSCRGARELANPSRCHFWTVQAEDVAPASW